MELSVVIPVYKGEPFLRELCNRLAQCLGQISPNFEILLVNDASPDDSWALIQDLASSAELHIKGINLSRNFGQHYAITAGLDQSIGEWVVVMDCDLQDQPEEIARFYKKAHEGYDIVAGQRAVRQDSFIKKTLSKLYYSLLSYLTSTSQDGSVGNFGIYHRKVIDSVCQLRENLRFFPIMVRWVGFRFAALPIEHAPRPSGTSGYTFKKLRNLAFDVMLAFSDKPLRIAVKLGFSISCLALLCCLYIVFKVVFIGVPVMGWPSLFASTWLLGGLIISLLGLVGIYVGKTFDQTKSRPLYIIQETTDARDA